MGFLLRLGASPQDAGDGAGHAFIEVYVRWEQLRSPKEYLRRAATNELIKLATRPRTDLDRVLRGCWAMEVVQDVYQQSEVQMVLNAMSKLPERQRQVMAWYYDGYSAVEIAENLGMPVATVRSNLRHARETLRRLGVGEGG